MVIAILTVIFLLSVVLCIRAKYRGPKSHVYIFKPLTTILIISIALYAGYANNSLYKYFILAGLIFCLGGDIFMMLPKDKFLYGLVSFLIAHLFFIIGFISSAGISVTWWLPVILLAVVIPVIILLFPFLEKMKMPVIIYILIIAAMAWLGWERYFVLKGSLPLLAAVGTLFFWASDFLLALNRFRKEFKSAEFFIYSTYYVSIWLIALSVSNQPLI